MKLFSGCLIYWHYSVQCAMDVRGIMMVRPRHPAEQNTSYPWTYPEICTVASFCPFCSTFPEAG